MKRFIKLVLLLCLVSLCKGQAAQPVPDTVLLADIKNEGFLLSNAMFFYDSTNSLPIAAVLDKSFTKFSGTYPRARIKPGKISNTLYLKLWLSNNTADDITGYIDPGIYFYQYDIYKIDGHSITREDPNNVSSYKKIFIGSGQTGYFLIALKPLKTDVGSLSPVFIHARYLDQYKLTITRHKTDIQVFGLILSGVLFMMILFMLANYVTSRKLEFLYNAAYSVCMFLLILFNSTVIKLTNTFNNFYHAYFDFFLLVTGTIFYISFARRFLGTKNNHTLLDLILKYAQRFMVLLLILYTFFNFFTDSYLPQFYLESFMKICFLLLGAAFIYFAFKRKDRLFSYIAAGNAMLVLFSSISLIIMILNIKPSSIFLSSLFYYNIGIILELIFFILGLTYKNRRELINEIKVQEALKLDAKKQEFETQLAVIKAQQEVRNRISADMHDDLGAGMTTISLYSELAKRKLADNPIPEIEKISTSANDLLNKMNAIIWSMSSSNDSLSNMIAYIRIYALEYFENTGVACKIEIPEKLPNIEVIGEIRRNVFLVVKEALNNILKHSKATEVSIKLIRVEDGLTLYIHDNGKGIDMDKIRQFGNGLKNMKKRMADIQVDFTIENNNGTLITMHRKIEQF